MLNNLLSIHNNRIVHRDLKPDNILYGNGSYALADFGTSTEIKDVLKNMGKGDTLKIV
jgi:serine/threonine protein kinase